MPRKPNPPPDDPEQSKRFLDTAKEVEADQDEKALDRTLKNIAADKRKRSSST